jgi:hypothetical protein
MTPLPHSDDREPTAAFDKRKAMLSSLRRVTLATPLIALLFAVLSIAPAEGGASCGARTLSQPFAPWLDLHDYFLMPGGDLESASGWTFGGGARLVNGNEPFKVHAAGDGKSLELPMGAWARSPSTCVDSDESTMRFFARNTGSPLSTLAVEARVRTTLLGLTTETTLPIGVVLGTMQSLQPSLPVVFKLSLNQLLGATTTVDFRFTTLGLGGDWQIDDVYVDPFKDRAAS